MILPFSKLDEIEIAVDEDINESNDKLSELINDNIKYDPSYNYLFNEIYEEKTIYDIFHTQFMNLNLSQISKFKYYPLLISNYIYRNNFKTDYKIDYSNYQTFNVDNDELDEYLFSLLLFNKKIFLNLENSPKFYIPKFDYFNKTTNNQSFLSNYLTEYPSRNKLSKEQISFINEKLLLFVKNKYSKIVSDKDKLQKDLENKNEKIIAEVKEKRNHIDDIPNKENVNNEEIDFLKYDKLLEIKKLEEKKEQNEFLINILNYRYNQIISIVKTEYIIDICFGLQSLLHYIYEQGLIEKMLLIDICNNLPLFKCEKDKLVLLLENNTDINLSHLFSLYEYFESLIFSEFIYHINKEYMVPLPLYLSKKIFYILEKDEMKNNIIFTKIELIEAIRKCLCRYIASSMIDENYFTEDINSDNVFCEIRSNKYNINPIATKFGGGGHAKASGVTLANKEEAMQLLKELDALIEE